VNGGQLLTNVGFTAPVTNIDGHSLTGGTASALAAADPSCQILDLTLGPLHLDLLGLVVDLNQVHLNITAQPGSGNLLRQPSLLGCPSARQHRRRYRRAERAAAADHLAAQSDPRPTLGAASGGRGRYLLPPAAAQGSFPNTGPGQDPASGQVGVV
jgi:hypothetical protein